MVCPITILPKQNEYWESPAGTMGSIYIRNCFLKKICIERGIEKGAEVLTQKKEIEKEKFNVYVPIIQERIRDLTYIQSEAIEDWLEGWLIDPKSFDPKKGLILKNILPIKV